MSALGQKRTFAVQKAMSALPLKADMCIATRDVRFVPIADVGPTNRLPLQRALAATEEKSLLRFSHHPCRTHSSTDSFAADICGRRLEPCGTFS